MFFSRQRNGARRWSAGPSDEAIAARVVEGETDLFEILMRRHNQRLSRAVRAFLKVESEVEEVMQQTYVDAFANLAQLRGALSLSNWLVRIAINESLTRLRQRSRFVTSDTGFEALDPDDPETTASQVELIRMLEEAIDKLPGRYRLVFVLREIEGLSTRETAGALGVGRDVVKTRLRRAKLLIRQLVGSRAYASKRDAFAFRAPRCDRVVKNVLEKLLQHRAPNIGDAGCVRGGQGVNPQ